MMQLELNFLKADGVVMYCSPTRTYLIKSYQLVLPVLE